MYKVSTRLGVAKMTKYLFEVKGMLQHFTLYSLQGMDQNSNMLVDALSRLATMDATSCNGLVYLEVSDEPNILRKAVMTVERSNGWLTPYLDYLNKGRLPSDRVVAKKIKHRSSYFYLIDGDLYRQSYSSPLLNYLVPSKAVYVLREVHERICRDYMGVKSLAYKLMRQGYYWAIIF